METLDVPTEPWFIFVDIVMIVCTGLSAILSVLFLTIVLTHRTCWSLPTLLFGNSCLTELLLSCVLLNMAVFALQQDLNPRARDASSCIYFGFFGYFVDCMQNYSYFHTAIYRYVSVVHPNQALWKSVKFQFALIIVQWIFCSVYALPLLLTGQIVYNVDNQICQVPLQSYALVMYVVAILYVIPIVGIVILYIRLTLYVREMSKQRIRAQTLFQARRQVRLVRRTFILAITLAILGIPYITVIVIAFFTTPPKYHFRIAYVFVDLAVLVIMFILYASTSQIRKVIERKMVRVAAIQPGRFTART